MVEQGKIEDLSALAEQEQPVREESLNGLPFSYPQLMACDWLSSIVSVVDLDLN